MFCFFALSALCFISCQQKSTALYHVSGKVSYKGVSLQSGIIVFSPDTNRGETGKVAFSKIESDGSYTLHTGDAAGVTAGWYRVTVAALGGPTANLESPPVSLVPDKYRDPLLSQLQCEVKANRDNHLDFNLD
jgi:hypothetical protein